MKACLCNEYKLDQEETFGTARPITMRSVLDMGSRLGTMSSTRTCCSEQA